MLLSCFTFEIWPPFVLSTLYASNFYTFPGILCPFCMSRTVFVNCGRVLCLLSSQMPIDIDVVADDDDDDDDEELKKSTVEPFCGIARHAKKTQNARIKCPYKQRTYICVNTRTQREQTITLTRKRARERTQSLNMRINSISRETTSIATYSKLTWNWHEMFNVVSCHSVFFPPNEPLLLLLLLVFSLVYMQTTAQYIMYLCRIYGVN